MDKNKLLIKLSESDRTNFGRVEFDKQSDEQKVFSAIWSLESEVNNGGFQQYFFNTDGDIINYAPVALRRIGAIKCASIVEEALSKVSKTPLPTNEDGRQKLVESLDAASIKQLDDLDTQFFSYPDDLTELLFEFVRSQPLVFGQI
jgi:hypothetical protein